MISSAVWWQDESYKYKLGKNVVSHENCVFWKEKGFYLANQEPWGKVLVDNLNDSVCRHQIRLKYNNLVSRQIDDVSAFCWDKKCACWRLRALRSNLLTDWDRNLRFSSPQKVLTQLCWHCVVYFQKKYELMFINVVVGCFHAVVSCSATECEAGRGFYLLSYLKTAQLQGWW